MIVKVQRPVYSRDAPTLIYNLSRSVVLMRHLTEAEEQKMGLRIKAFFEAEVKGSEVVLLELIADQTW